VPLLDSALFTLSFPLSFLAALETPLSCGPFRRQSARSDMFAAATAGPSRSNPAYPVNHTPRPPAGPEGPNAPARKMLPRPGEPRAPAPNLAGPEHGQSTSELAAFFRTTAPPKGNQPPALDPPVSSAFSVASTASVGGQASRLKARKIFFRRRWEARRVVGPRRLRFETAGVVRTTGGHPYVPYGPPLPLSPNSLATPDG